MTLFLRSLHLSHFRSHKLGRLETDGRPVAIYGPNGAGKTSILEAVSLLSPGRGLRRAAAQEMARRPESLGWKIRAQVHSNGQDHDIETWSDAGAARQVKINDKPATQMALGRITRVVWLIPVMDRLWVEGAEGRRRFLDRATLSFAPDHGETVLTYEKAMRERNRLLKDQVRDGHWYAALEARMAETGALIHQRRTETIAALMAAQEAAQTTFPTADLRLDADMPTTPDDLRAALTDGRGRDMMAGRTLVGPHRSDLGATYRAKDIDARDCSTGEQKALLVSLILANARALPAPPILLLDEVAAHLDADRRAALYDEICDLGAQAWMTGTGAELFTTLGERAQCFCVTETNGVSEIAEGAL